MITVSLPNWADMCHWEGQGRQPHAARRIAKVIASLGDAAVHWHAFYSTLIVLLNLMVCLCQ